MANLLNPIHGGLLPRGVAVADPVGVVFPDASGPLMGFEPFGGIKGLCDRVHDSEMKSMGSWVTSAYGSPTGHSFGLVAPTASDPLIIQLHSGTVASTGIQGQGTDGAGNALARFWSRSPDQYLHGLVRLRTANLSNHAFHFGFAPVGLALTNGTTFNAASFLGIFKPSGGAVVKGVVRRGGTSNINVDLATIVTNTWYEFGWRMDTRGGAFWVNGTQIGVDFGGSAWAPNVALALTLGNFTITTVDQVLDVQGGFVGQESY